MLLCERQFPHFAIVDRQPLLRVVTEYQARAGRFHRGEAPVGRQRLFGVQKDLWRFQ